MTATHDINKAIMKAVIDWDRSKGGWVVTLTRLDGSTETWSEITMADATDAIVRQMETEDNWP